MSRRGENIWKRKDGRWEARYIRGRESSGRSLYGSVYAKTYTEVKQKRDKLLLEVAGDGPIKYAPKSIGAIVNEFLFSHKSKVKVSTFAHYTQIAESHLLPDLGEKDISSFTAESCDEYVSMLLSSGKGDGTGLAAKTVRDILSLLKMAIKFAVSKKYVPEGILNAISTPKMVKTKTQILTPSQRKKLESFSLRDDDSYKFGIYLTLYTGLRIGELCALQWTDVDCENATISINKTILRVKNTDSSSKSKTYVTLSSPKTRTSERIIPLPFALNEMLKKLKQKTSTCDNGYVLTGTNCYIEPRCYYARYKRYLRSCGIPNFSFHALRHTFATRCIEAGVDPKALSEILGHASVRITLDKYVHPTLEAKRNGMERLLI